VQRSLHSSVRGRGWRLFPVCGCLPALRTDVTGGRRGLCYRRRRSVRPANPSAGVYSVRDNYGRMVIQLTSQNVFCTFLEDFLTVILSRAFVCACVRLRSDLCELCARVMVI